jgi:hypothetical protein
LSVVVEVAVLHHLLVLPHQAVAEVVLQLHM